MRFPTTDEIQRLRSNERNFSQLFLGIQRGKELGDCTGGTLMVGHHYMLQASDGYEQNEHLLWFGGLDLSNSDIRPNQTVLVGTRDDPSLYGSVRIRAITTTDGPAGEHGLYLEPNELRTDGYLQVGDCIWVDGVYRLYRKLPHINSGTIYEDGNPDVAAGTGIRGMGIGFNVNYLDRPVALMGSPRFAWTGESIDFYGWRSHARGVGPEGHALDIQNWLWDFDGGVCVGPGIGYPGSPGHPIHARWDSAGEYIVSLTVEDNSGKAGSDMYGVPYARHAAVRPVLVYDRPGEGDNPPYTQFEIESLTGKYGSGWSARITVYGTADGDEFPDNALVIVYAEDWHDGQQGSIGGWYGQEGILFCGYIRADSVVVDFEKSSVTFEAQTIEQWMKDISLWPMNCVSDDAAPTQWHHFEDMTVEDVLWYLAEMRSNLKDVTDCFFASDVGVEKELGFIDLTEASLYDQMSEQLGSCFFGQLSASRHGSIHLFKHKNMMDLNERAWWGPPVYTFARQDWRDELQIGEERQRDSVAQVDFIGFFYDTNGNPQECYSLAPARQTNFGRIEKVTGILLTGDTLGGTPDPQDECNTFSGLYRAWKNIRFPHIRVPARNNRVLEPATLDYFAIELDEDDTIRGYVWEGKEFLCTGVSLSFNNEKGIMLADVEGEASTWGPDGVAGDYPTQLPAGNPPSSNPSEYWPVYDGAALGHDGNVAYFCADNGHVYRGTGLLDDPSDVVYEDLGIPSGGANICWFMALSELDPVNVAMVATAAGLYRTGNLSDPSPIWTLERARDFAGNWGFVHVINSRWEPNWWAAAEEQVGQGAGGRNQGQLHYSTNNAGIWTSTYMNLAWNGTYPTTKMELSPNIPGRGYTASQRYTGANGWLDYNWWYDYGASYIGGGVNDSIFGRPVSNPHHRAYDDDLEGLWCHSNRAHFPIDRAIPTFGHTDPTDMAGCPTVNTDDGLYWCDSGRNEYNEFEYYWGLQLCISDAISRFHRSPDGVSDWDSYTMPALHRHAVAWRWNCDRVYAAQDGSTAPIAISADGGQTWTQMTGNWDSVGGDLDVYCVAPLF